MPAFQPTAAQFRAFRDEPHDGLLAQVNLLKFKVKAIYAPSDPEFGDGSSGAEAYQRYADAFALAAAEVEGVCWLSAAVERYFIGNGDWDCVYINLFPNRQAFIATLNHATYKDMSRHRDAGLLAQELLVTRPAMLAGQTL